MSCFWSTLWLTNMTSRIRCKSFLGTSGVSNPKLARCLKKSLVPKHFVKRSATLSVPARCSIHSSFELILAFIQAILISTWRLRLGMSCPTSNCKADELSDSNKICGTSLSLISPIPVYTLWQKLLNATDSCATICKAYNSASHDDNDTDCCCLASDLTNAPSQNTTPPEIPFRPLNLYGANDASANECRIECRAGPIIRFSYSGDGNLRHVPTSSKRNLKSALIADSVPWFGLACWLPMRLKYSLRSWRDWAIHKSLPSARRKREYAEGERSCIWFLSPRALSKIPATSGAEGEPLVMLNSAKVVSRNFGSTPIVRESSSKLRCTCLPINVSCPPPSFAGRITPVSFKGTAFPMAFSTILSAASDWQQSKRSSTYATSNATSPFTLPW